MPFSVMAGLVPAIHVVRLARSPCFEGRVWSAAVSETVGALDALDVAGITVARP